MYRGYESWSRGLDVYGSLPLPAEAVRRTYSETATGLFTAEDLRSLAGLSGDQSQDDSLENAQTAAYATMRERLNRPLMSGTIRNFYVSLSDRYTLTDPSSGNVLFKYVADDGQLNAMSGASAVTDPSDGDRDNPVVFAPVSLNANAVSAASESRSAAPYVMEYSSGSMLLGASDTLSQALRRLILFEYHLLAGGPVSGMKADEQRKARMNILSVCEPHVWRGDL